MKRAVFLAVTLLAALQFAVAVADRVAEFQPPHPTVPPVELAEFTPPHPTVPPVELT